MSSVTRGKASVGGRGYARGLSQSRGTSTRGTRGGSRSRYENTQESARHRSGRESRSRSGSPASHNGPKNAKSKKQQPSTDYQARYTALEANRKRERVDAIRHGLIADPDKPRSLADAITLVGTCQDMCAEFERVERIVQKDVWKEETENTSAAVLSTDREPDEARMVKKFRRAAAGIEEQLPSDLRPPQVLQATCNYLFRTVIGNADSLGSVHHFVWDRTRAIRNDFSIQQITRPDDLKIAIECFENIARFHILSLHQLALPQKPYDKYDWQQEREQLDRTLLSLMQYYETGRGRVPLPNEAEFRSYSVVFQLQDPLPDVEDRVQSWPREIALHPRVRQALQLYASACTTHDPQGPLKPGARHVSAQQDWHKFWRLVESRGVPYLMACVAEIYFNHVRKFTLQALIAASGSKITTQWAIEEVRDMLAFDDDEATEEFCERYTLGFKQVDGSYLLDLSGWRGKSLPDAKPTASKQSRSQLVEQKRYSRSLPAIIIGLTIHQAQQQGMMIEEDGDSVMVDSADEDISDQETLFVSENTKPKPLDAAASTFLPAAPNPFGSLPSVTPQPTGLSNALFGGALSDASAKSAFGQPSASQAAFSTFGQPSAGQEGGSMFGKPSSTIERAASPFAPKSISTTTSSTGFSFGKPSESATSRSGFQFVKPSSNERITGITNTTSSTGFDFEPPTAKDAQSHDEPAPAVATTANATAETDAVAGPPPALQASKSPFASTFGQFHGNNTLQTASGDAGSKFTFSQASNGSVKNAETKESTSPLTKETLFASDWPSTASSMAKNKPTFDFMSAAKKPEKSEVEPAPSQHATTIAPSVLQAAAPSTSGFTFTEPKIKPVSGFFSASPAEDSFATAAPKAASVATSLFSNSQGQTPTSTSAKTTDTNESISFTSTITSTPTTNSTTVAGPSQVLSTSKPFTSHTSTPSTLPKVPSAVKRLPSTPPFRFDDVIQQLAKDLTLDNESGFLRQYVDFIVGQIVTEAQESVYQEKIEQEAKEYRAHKLSLRYALLWRATSKRRRLARQGRGQRQRAKERLYEIKSQGSQASSVNGSRRASPRSREVSRQEQVDAMFQQSVRAGRWKATPLVAREEVNGDLTHKSVSRVDNSGRVVKPTPSTESLRRSVTSSGITSPARNTTRSSYFRRKALGLDVKSDSVSYGSRKRAHSEVSTDSHLSPQHSSPVSSSIGASPARHQSSVDSSTANKLQRVDLDDDALLAKLRAAREALDISTTSLQRERLGLESPPSMGPPTVPYQSPSLDRARAEARRRQSLSMTSGEVPAYRLRESKFVPRELYGRAIENARHIRENRSRASSRPTSQASLRADDVPMTNGFNGPLRSASPQVEFDLAPADDFTQTLSGQAVIDPDILDDDGIVHSNYSSFHDSTEPSQKPAIVPESVHRLQTPAVQDSIGAMQDYYQHPPPIDASHDFTIQPSQIPESLNASFRLSNGSHKDDHLADLARSASQHTPYPFPAVNVRGGDYEVASQRQEESGYSHEAVSKPRYSDSNRFAALQQDEEDENDEDAEEGSQGSVENEEDSNGFDSEEDAGEHMYSTADNRIDEEDSPAEGEYSEEDEDGDIDEDDEDEDDEEDEEEEYESEQPTSNAHYARVQAAAQPPVNETLAAIGNNEDDAIELSD